MVRVDVDVNKNSDNIKPQKKTGTDNIPDISGNIPKPVNTDVPDPQALYKEILDFLKKEMTKTAAGAISNPDILIDDLTDFLNERKKAAKDPDKPYIPDPQPLLDQYFVYLVKYNLISDVTSLLGAGFKPSTNVDLIKIAVQLKHDDETRIEMLNVLIQARIY